MSDSILHPAARGLCRLPLYRIWRMAPWGWESLDAKGSKGPTCHQRYEYIWTWNTGTKSENISRTASPFAAGVCFDCSVQEWDYITVSDQSRVLGSLVRCWLFGWDLKIQAPFLLCQFDGMTIHNLAAKPPCTAGTKLRGGLLFWREMLTAFDMFVDCFCHVTFCASTWNKRWNERWHDKNMSNAANSSPQKRIPPRRSRKHRFSVRGSNQFWRSACLALGVLFTNKFDCLWSLKRRFTKEMGQMGWPLLLMLIARTGLTLVLVDIGFNCDSNSVGEPLHTLVLWPSDQVKWIRTAVKILAGLHGRHNRNVANLWIHLFMSIRLKILLVACDECDSWEEAKFERKQAEHVADTNA